MSTAAAAGDSLAADVSAAVRADWGTRDSSQFRLAFAIATDADVAADVIVCDTSSAKLELSYWYLEPRRSRSSAECGPGRA
jgi:hypothetical protein